MRARIRRWLRSLREILKIANSWFGKWRKNLPRLHGVILLGQRGLSEIGDLEPVNIEKGLKVQNSWLLHELLTLGKYKCE